MSKHKAFTAFTLAEILITIGIIGIVAECTIPTLMHNMQDQYLKNQFKKTYSTIYNATTLVKANNGLYPPCRYDASGNWGTSSDKSDCQNFWNELKKNLQVIKVCDNNSYANGCIPNYPGGGNDAGCPNFSHDNLAVSDSSFVLSDGTIIVPYSYTMPIFMADINGMKPPNKWGYDLFDFSWRGDSNDVRLKDGNCFVPASGGYRTMDMFQYAFQ